MAQPSIDVFYKRYRVVEYDADVLVDEELVLDLKCVERLRMSARPHALTISIRRGYASASW